MSIAVLIGANFDSDKFENVAQCYDDFHNHQVPGGLKVCLETAFGREPSGK